MRIRSIKPEFWKSVDITNLDWNDRLLFIGLWSYVDDNGVGRDEEPIIIGDLFPADMYRDPRETLGRVSGGLRRLYLEGIIERYEVDGRPFLHITNWDRHQRIHNANKPRYPLPTSENATLRETLPRPSGDSTETLGTGAGEQRSRGTEEQGIKDSLADARESCANPDSDLAQVGAAELRDSYPADFEVFWSIYPIKRGKGKALKAWSRAIKRSSKESINAGAAKYRDDPNRRDQYTKYAEGWLNADSWNDEPLPARNERQTNGLSDAQWQRAYERAEVYDQEHERPATIVEGVWEAS